MVVILSNLRAAWRPAPPAWFSLHPREPGSNREGAIRMAASPKKFLYCGPFRRLEPLLAPMLERLGEGDRMRRRRVLVISNRLREHLQERLARQGAFAGVSFLTLKDLAEEIALGDLQRARLSPISRLGAAALAGRVLREGASRLGPLRDAAAIDGYGESILATLTDLAEAGMRPGDIRFSSGFPKTGRALLKDLSLLAEIYEKGLAACGFYDDGLLFLRACERAEAAPPRVSTIVYGFSDMNALQRRLLSACIREEDAIAFLPADPEAPACAYAMPFLEWMEGQGFEREELPDGEAGPFDRLAANLFGDETRVRLEEDSLAVVSAPTESREIYELTREILYSRTPARAGGEPSSVRETGMILPAAGKYERLILETFRSLRVPAESGGRARLADLPAGRIFLRMLALKERGYPREEVIRFLADANFTGSRSFLSAPEISDGLSPASLPSQWEYLSRGFLFLSGEEAWRASLKGETEEAGRRGDSIRRGIARSLSHALEVLFKRLGAFPEPALPSVHAARALEAYGEMTDGLRDSGALADSVKAVGALDPILGDIGADAFREWARKALAGASVRPVDDGNPGGGVCLLTMLDARGLFFDTVAIPGLAEGVFPSAGGEDLLLPDLLREKVNRALGRKKGDPGAGLPPKGARSAEERFLFWTAIQAAARRMILGFSRGGAGGLPESAPSPFLNHLAAALEGDPGEEVDLAGRIQGRYRAAPPSLDVSVIREMPAGILEWDLARMLVPPGEMEKGALGYLDRLYPQFERKRMALAARWKRDALTAHDGMLTEPDLLEKIGERGGSARRPVSVTDIETFFRCPYRYALSKIFRVEARVEASPPLEAEPDVRGRLFHDALRLFYEKVIEMKTGLSHMTPAVRRAILKESVARAFSRSGEEGEALLPLPWRLLQERIRQDLGAFLGLVSEHGGDWLPLETEGSFGRAGVPPLEIDLAEAGRRIFLSGRYDLLEYRGEDEYRYVDFKSGKRFGKQTPGLEGGTRLQLDLYARQGKQRFGGGARVEGAYAFVSERGGYGVHHVDPDTVEARRGDVDRLLSYFLRAAEEGAFFPTPSRKTCARCDFVPLCGPERIERAGRKAGDRLRAEFQGLQDAVP